MHQYLIVHSRFLRLDVACRTMIPFFSFSFCQASSLSPDHELHQIPFAWALHQLSFWSMDWSLRSSTTTGGDLMSPIIIVISFELLIIEEMVHEQRLMWIWLLYCWLVIALWRIPSHDHWSKSSSLFRFKIQCSLVSLWFDLVCWWHVFDCFHPS